MLIQLTTTQWLALSPEVKAKLKEIFGIPRSEGTHMMDGRVLSDGHTHRDLERISVGAMQNYTGNKKQEDFYKLFEQVLAQVEAELAPPAAPVVVGEAVVIAKPAEELFIEHNGKTYKLTEVAPAPAAQVVAASTTLYPPAPQTPLVVNIPAAAGANKGAGKGTTRGRGKGGAGKAAAKAK